MGIIVNFGFLSLEFEKMRKMDIKKRERELAEIKRKKISDTETFSALSF